MTSESGIDSAKSLTTAVSHGVERTLELAQTWLAWDGRPMIGEDPSRIYTPHKALRRHTDHLIDHLAQIEALYAAVPSLPDGWHGSSATTPSDWAQFTEADLGEAQQRLRRLAAIFEIRLKSIGTQGWDEARGSSWTIRQIVEHVADAWYAEQVGDLRISRT